MRSTHKFYGKGTDKQRSPDFIFDVKRSEDKKIAQFDTEAVSQAQEWLERVDKVYKAWRSEVKRQLKLAQKNLHNT